MITERTPSIQWAFEQHALFNHQNELFGDITERATKIDMMTNAERDRFQTFQDAGKIIQERHDHMVPQYEQQEVLMEELDCTEAQATRFIELMKLIVPGYSAKRDLIKKILENIPQFHSIDLFCTIKQHRFLYLEQWIKYLSNIESTLAECDTHWEDAMLYSEPYHEEVDILDEALTEEEIVELQFKDEQTPSLDTHVYRTVYDEGSGRPFLTQREFDKLIDTVRHCEVKQLKEIGSWLYDTNCLTWEQSQLFWKDVYQPAKKLAIEQSKEFYNIISSELNKMFSLVREERQVRYLGAWLFAQMEGTPFNGKEADIRFNSLDNVARKWIWNKYNNLKYRITNFM